MCGIITFFGDEKSKQELKERLEKLNHRGPDEDDLCNFNNLYLGHKRLSIIGPEHGHQPIPNETGKKNVVANGEIYNYQQLKEKIKENHQFNTKTDSEVIVHLYEEMGVDCVKQLEGMFAFVLSDDGKPFVARDTLGIKPLYYAEDNSGIYFASELKALMDATTGEIKEFPPGHYYTPETGLQSYGEVNAPFAKIETGKEQNLNEITIELREKLEQAVRRRLMTDVPLGVLLSGGLDSSLTSAIANKYTDRKLKSFCVGMEGGSDLPAAQKVADHIGTDHYEYIYDTDEVLEILPKVIYYLESFEPSVVRTAIPTYFVARLASEHVKVVLSGSGSDEIFSGYSYYKTIDSKEKLHYKLLESINGLHNINLLRLDRMTMAHSLEGRVPFLDLDFVNYAASLPPELKIYGQGEVEKWILRKAFADTDYLPQEILWRDKEKFAEGCGSQNLIKNKVETEISDAELKKAQQQLPIQIRTKEELYYYRIFKRFYSTNKASNTVGRWVKA